MCAIHVKAFTAEGDACSSNPLGDCDLPDTCHGKGASVDPAWMSVLCAILPIWNGMVAMLVRPFFFVVEGTGCGSDVDTDCDDPDTCEGMRVHPLYV